MFTDIEGFTGLSERLAPAEVARHPERLSRHRGAGDPAPRRRRQQLHRRRPVRQLQPAAAARESRRRRHRRPRSTSSRPWPARPSRRRATLRTRIGINTGTVIGVTIGTENRLNYTLLGDAVNIASRVEQLNKQFGTGILATESTVRAAGAGCELRAAGRDRRARPSRTTSSSIASGRRHERAATPAEIAAIRRRYLLMATSIFVLDLAITLIFIGRRRRLGQSAGAPVGIGVVLLLGVNWLLAALAVRADPALPRRQRVLRGASQRRLTQLPLLTARGVGILAFAGRRRSGCRRHFWIDPAIVRLPQADDRRLRHDSASS